MPLPRSDVSALFKRELQRHEYSIRSTCKRCGLVIEGGVDSAHAQSEHDHVAMCRRNVYGTFVSRSASIH